VIIIPATARWVVHSEQGRNDCINYVKDLEKTDGGVLITGINCSADFCAYEMKMNNNKFRIEEDKESRTCYHGYQSFDPKEKDLTPEEVHKMGVELVKRLYPDFQVLVTTHIDQAHLHNHFVINAVNTKGRKLEDRLSNPLEGLYGLRDMSDKIALENGLKIIEDAPKIGKFHKNKYLYQLASKSWRSQIIEMIEELKIKCYSFDELLESLSLEGYLIKQGKNIKIKPYGKQNFVTMKVLGEDYSEESLKKFFYEKNKNNVSLKFKSYSLNITNSEILNFYNSLAISSKQSILYSMKNLNNNSNYPKYYNSRYMEYKRYQQLVDTIEFLNEQEIYNYNSLINKINELKLDIQSKEKEYEEQVSYNETLQLRVPLCHLYLKYVTYYDCYVEQIEMLKENIEPSDEVKTFLEIKKELQVNDTDDVKQILSSANRIKAETNRQYAYLSYLKNKASELEKIKSMSMENEKGYIKSISFSKRMIDETRSTEKEYCIRIPYSELYIFIPKNNVAWISYDNRGIIYLIDDMEYSLYNKENQIIQKIKGEELEEVEKKEKERINEYYKSK